MDPEAKDNSNFGRKRITPTSAGTKPQPQLWKRQILATRPPVLDHQDRNSMELTAAEDTKKRWEEYPEELFKKDLHDPNNHNRMITHLEPDILEYKVK